MDALADESIAAAALSDPDARLLTESQLLDFRRVADVTGMNILEKSRTLARETKNKQLVSIRYDKDVFAFFGVWHADTTKRYGRTRFHPPDQQP